jgi:tetratricopeptide (TPR) repeat protein
VPLAIELAASRVVTLSPREIAKRLDERFKVLQTDAPDLPPRQRALRAAIDWSHGLLSPEDQALFAQLAVFAGGFTLEDAEAVCEHDTPDVETMEAVARLRSNSLLRSEIVPQTQQTRYFMLEALREYAGEKLRAHPERAESTFARHADYFLDFAQVRISHLRDGGAAQAIAEMESSFDNVRSAMDWCERHARWTQCARLSLALGTFLQCRGFGHEAVRRLQTGLEAIERDRDEIDPPAYFRLKAALLREKASVHLDHFAWVEARTEALASRALFEAGDDARGVAQATNLLGLCAKAEADFAVARSNFEEALAMFQGTEDTLGVALALNNLGLVEYTDAAGSPTKAIEYWTQALTFHHELEDKRGIAQVLTNLGALAQEQGREEDAWQAYLEALRWERELQHTLGVARALSNLGEISESRRQWLRACRFYAAAQCLFNKIGSPYEQYSRDLLMRLSAQLNGEGTLQLEADGERLKERSLSDVVHWALAGDE